MTPGSISNPSIVVGASGTNASGSHNSQTQTSQPSGKTNVTKGITIGCHMNMCPGFISNSSSSSNTTTTAGSSNNSSNNNNNNNNSNSHNVSSSLSKCSNKFPSKIDPRFTGPSTLRQLLPIALCVLSFATVLSVLIIYMDTTEIRHQQFRLNMSRDYELIGVAQDDPTLVAFIREIHMKKYPLNFLKNAPIEHLNFTERHELTPDMARYIASLVRDKINGNFIQSMTGATSYAMTAPLLADTLNWGGIIVEPEPRRYFTLRKQNVHRPKVQVVHACLSPNGYPKEVTLHNDEDADVRINSLVDDEISSFNSRVKCFPLYTIMLAVNKTEYDLLSLGCSGHELQILQTLPFKNVNIEMISIHLTQNQSNATEYIQSITKFLFGKSYKLQKRFENNYIYQRINNKRLIRKVTP